MPAEQWDDGEDVAICLIQCVDTLNEDFTATCAPLELESVVALKELIVLPPARSQVKASSRA